MTKNPAKLSAVRDEKVEKKAIQIHNESEAKQKKLYSQRGYAPYAPIEWENLTEGFYKEQVRKLAKERLKTSAK